MSSLGKIAILGGGTWATALAKIVLMNEKHINWFIRSDEQIEGFYKLGRNPNYLTNVKFNLAQITFYSNIEKAIKDSDIVIIAIPSPYIKQYFRKIRSNSAFSNKFILTAVKGMIPNDNLVLSDYMQRAYKIPDENIGVISGPCHAEEVALERLSFLTVASSDVEKAKIIAETIESRILKTSISTDVLGIEVAAVLKNIYAIMSGVCSGLQFGDNFQAVLMTNCAKEMQKMLSVVAPMSDRCISEQHYLGDMLVTGYSQFSRNRTFGTMIGRGYSVKSAQLEMEMIAEGYFGAKCIHEMVKNMTLDIPIVETVYEILYEKLRPQDAVKKLIENF